MKVSFWHHTADQQPSQPGYYLCYRGWGMGGKGDGDSDYGYLWYDKKFDEWRDYESRNASGAIVYYWTDAQPDDWSASDPPVSKRKQAQKEMHPAEQEALAELNEAIKRYETVRALCAKQP